MNLSLPEQAALQAFQRQRDDFKSAVWTEARANPSCTEGQLRAFVVNRADPYPGDPTGIRDRGALFDEYVANAGGFAAFMGALLAYPRGLVMAAAPELGRPLPTSEAAYKQHLASCDLDRRSDLDGRGTLREESLAAFSRFFLEVCLDQVRFMEGLVQPGRLRERILRWVEEEHRLGGLPRETGAVLEAILYRGELPRGEVPGLLGYSARQARRFVAELTKREVVVSDVSVMSGGMTARDYYFPYGLTVPAQWFSMMARCHMDRFGTRPEQLGAVARDVTRILGRFVELA